jgi:hypothetical protein
MDRARTSRWTVTAALLASLFAAAVLPVALLAGTGTSEGYDEANYHLPVIRRFASELPSPDLRDYASATAPGYHLLMSLPAWLGVGIGGLRSIGSLFGLALVLLTWRVAAVPSGPRCAMALALPLAACSYVLSGSAWLTTDMLSVLLGSAVIGLVAWSPPTARTFATAGILFAAAVCVRQTNVYLAVPILAVGVLGSPMGRSATAGEQWAPDEPRSWRRPAMAVLALVPAALALAAFAKLWGGLTPPQFRAQHGRALSNLTPSYGLALIGAWGSVMLLPLLPEAWTAVRRRRTDLFAIAAFAGLLASVRASGWSFEAGRWGGPLWTLVKAVPCIRDRSPVIVLGAACGAAILAVLWLMAAEVRRGRQASVVIIALVAGMFAAQSGNSQVWERYFDPAILVALAWLVALAVHPSRPYSAPRAVIGGLALAAVQAAISAVNYLLPAIRG